jgi:hypothetical protein
MKRISEMENSKSKDLVLEEIWRIKDSLSKAYGHDVDRLFEEARQRQKHSGHVVVNLRSSQSPKS